MSVATSIADTITDEERAAALRFCETCEDGQEYDVPSAMMRRLAQIGLVKHKGGGFYEMLPAMLEIRDAA